MDEKHKYAIDMVGSLKSEITNQNERGLVQVWNKGGGFISKKRWLDRFFLREVDTEWSQFLLLAEFLSLFISHSLIIPLKIVYILALKIVCILEFKRSTDRDEGFLEVKDAEAHEQHKSIIGALKAAAPEREFEQINFVVGNRGSVVESDFYTKLKKLDIPEGKKDKLFADHVTQVCEAHNRVIVSFLQQVQGGTRPTTEGSRENIGHSVHVWGDGERNTRL